VDLKKQLLIILFCLSLIIFVLPLPFIEITSGHEAREGIRLRAIQTSGNWLFSDVLRKPPLYYWLSGFIAYVRGGTVDALSLRLPSGILATVGVMVVFVAGRYLATSTGAAWAGFILLTSPLYVQQSHSGRTDMTLSVFVACSLLIFFHSYTAYWRQGQHAIWRSYCFYCLLALTVLSKGPVGLILVFLPIVSFLFWRWDWLALRPLLHPGPLLLFTFLCGGWYISALWSAGEEFWRTQIMEENVSRFIGGIDRMSPLYYVGPLFGELAPWSLVLPFALWRAVKERTSAEGPFFLALWWLSIVLFFQLALYKRARYLLPAVPPTALLAGWWCATQLPVVFKRVQDARWWKPILTIASLLACLGLLLGALLLVGIQNLSLFSCQALPLAPIREVRDHAEYYCSWASSHFWLAQAWFYIFALCVACAFGFLWRRRWERSLAMFIIALVLIYSGLYPSWLIVTGWMTSPRPFAHRIVKQLDTNQSVSFIDPYDERGVPVLFALQDEKKLVAVQWPWGAPQPPLSSGYYLVTDDRRKDVLASTAGTWTEVLRDASPTAWPIALFYYSIPSL